MYTNIGTPKACLFVFMSNRLLRALKQHPLLYEAVEEALISAKNDYYSIGIIVWYDLLKEVLHASSTQDSQKRNIPAHDILKTRSTKQSYDDLLKKFKKEAKKRYLIEVAKKENKKDYEQELYKRWEEYKETFAI